MSEDANEQRLKTCNTELISQLKDGLSELKSLVKKHPAKEKSSSKTLPEGGKSERQRRPNKPTKVISTSTPKHAKSSCTGVRFTPLAKEVHSLLIADSGNVKPHKKSGGTPAKTYKPGKTTGKPPGRTPGRTPDGAKYKFPKSILRSRDRTNNIFNNKENLKSSKAESSRLQKKSGGTPLKSSKGASQKSNKVCFSPSVGKKGKQERSFLGEDDAKSRVDTSMVGYDWIAAMIDNDTSITEKPDDFFEDLVKFRNTNWNDCKGIKSSTANVSSLETSVLPSDQPNESLMAVQSEFKEKYPLCCTGNGAYMVNNRLNLLPIHGPYSACPTCKSKPPSQCDADGYIRVSIPRSSIKSPYKLRPHRRKSFDPSDSVALSMHCLAGWEASKPSCVRGPPNVDLASHTAKKGLTTVRALRSAKTTIR